ncbi:MAG: hypothetical protein N5P05_002663 [Chroococcopsis gigantea SAG 12.99]|jgi:hypothetical protein|nr:hypothetical protein [Chlorogloea purpurea SAG 13.99]MDV3001057.1 hypothetical protein [Chroococcopsis gigantea SAG 12.99]
MSWKRLNRGDCPICSGTRKDCRQSTITGLIHCRDCEAVPKDYIFRGIDNIGFGMWAFGADAEVWCEEKRREWQQVREAVKEKERLRYCASLSDADRDKVIRQILGQLQLSGQHRRQLRERGMTDEEIDSRKYRSVGKWQKLSRPVDDRLAGVQKGGRGLNVWNAGILCPIPNHVGQFVAWQIRFDDPGEFAKYLWASSESTRKENGPSAHTRNGELPLAFYPASGKQHRVVKKWFKDAKVIPVALTEGVAFKPAIASQRLGIHAIGASGGNFASSPETLRAYFKSIETAYKSSVQPILFADGGCVDNPNVIEVYNKLIRLLRGWGMSPKIAWWGQASKVDGDIDEIDEKILSSMCLLSPEEFSGLVKKTAWQHQIQEEQQRLRSLTQKPYLHLSGRYLPDLNGLVPTNGIVALKSFKGSGKSEQIKKMIESARGRGMKVISITPRRALGRQQSLNWNIEWGGDAEVPGLHPMTLLENLDTLGICWDSLWKLKYRDWSNTMVIVDESELALMHLLLSSTCKEKRPLILQTLQNKLRECLYNGGLLLLADADLTDLSVDYFRSLVPGIPVYTVVNEYKSPELGWEVDFLTGKKDLAITELFAELENTDPRVPGQRIAVATDSQDQAEALERHLLSRFPDFSILRIDSTTTETDAGREFVERPNEKILELRPDVLIYTPSMGAGVSIDVKWFDRVYAFFNGVIEPSQCRQMLARVRDTIPRIVWCRRRGKLEGNVSFLPAQIKSRLWSFHNQTSILIDVARAIAGDDSTDAEIRSAYDSIWNGEKQCWDNPHVELYCNLMARKNYGIHNLASELLRGLIAEGHRVKEYDTSFETPEGSDVAAIKKGLPLEEARCIAGAEDISLELALSLKQKPGITEVQRHQIAKALLRAELPGVELTPEFVHKAITADRRRWLNAHKLFWYSQNPEKVKTLDRREWLEHLSKFIDGAVYLPDIRTYSLQVKVLRDIGLFDVIDLNNPDKEYCGDDEAILEMMRRVRRFSRSVGTAFNLRFNKGSRPIQFLNLLLGRLGLRLKFHRQSSSGTRFYRIDSERLLDPDRLAVLDSLETKLSRTLTDTETEVSHTPAVSIYNKAGYCDSTSVSTIIASPPRTSEIHLLGDADVVAEGEHRDFS